MTEIPKILPAIAAERAYGRATLYMSGSVVLGIAALLLGLALADQLMQRP